jgi:CBS domain-containing protein
MTMEQTTSLKARPLADVRVEEAMHRGVLKCPLWTPLEDVARMMATYRVHSIVALGEGGDEDGEPLLWGVVSDLDLAAAAAGEDVGGRTAGGTAATELVTIAADETLDRAAQLMREHAVAHLVVVSRETDEPIGILSTLDLAAAIAGMLHSRDARATRVEELMTRRVVTVPPDMPLKQVARLLVERGISGAPVVRDGEVLGVISERDFLVKERGRLPSPGGVLGWLIGDVMEDSRAKLEARTASEAMTAPAITIESWRSPASAAGLMLEAGVKRLPVVKHGRLVGMLSRADLVRAFTRTDAEIEREIREDVIVGSLWMSPNDVDVQVQDGEVTLSGAVETPLVAELLPRQVERVPGVLSVRSNLTASPEPAPRRLFQRLSGQ